MRVILLILGLTLLLSPFLFNGGGDKPAPPVPVPEPEELSDLAKEIQIALEDQPDDMPARYAGWFRAIGDTLENGDESVKELREAWVKSRKIIGLPGVLGDIVKKKTLEFETSNVDRKAYAGVWDELADACEELTGGE